MYVKMGVSGRVVKLSPTRGRYMGRHAVALLTFPYQGALYGQACSGSPYFALPGGVIWADMQWLSLLSPTRGRYMGRHAVVLFTLPYQGALYRQTCSGSPYFPLPGGVIWADMQWLSLLSPTRGRYMGRHAVALLTLPYQGALYGQTCSGSLYFALPGDVIWADMQWFSLLSPTRGRYMGRHAVALLTFPYQGALYGQTCSGSPYFPLPGGVIWADMQWLSLLSPTRGRYMGRHAVALFTLPYQGALYGQTCSGSLYFPLPGGVIWADMQWLSLLSPTRGRYMGRHAVALLTFPYQGALYGQTCSGSPYFALPGGVIWADMQWLSLLCPTRGRYMGRHAVALFTFPYQGALYGQTCSGSPSYSRLLVL